MKKKILISTAAALTISGVIWLANNIDKSPAQNHPLKSKVKEEKQPAHHNKNTGKVIEGEIQVPGPFVEKMLTTDKPDFVKLGFDAKKLLRMELSDADFDGLLAFLKDSPSKDKAHLGLHSLKNEIIMYLIERGEKLEQLGDSFLDILNDSKQHPVIKDYVLQFVGEYFEKRWPYSGVKSYDSEQKPFIDAVKASLEYGQDSVAGTALNCLQTLSEKYEGSVDSSFIKKKAFEMALDPGQTEPTRMSAMHTLARYPSKENSQILSDTAFNESNSVMLRMAAIHASVKSKIALNENTDELRKNLKEITSRPNEDRRLIMAATSAQSKLMKFLNKGER